jgi:hypothetical protein
MPIDSVDSLIDALQQTQLLDATQVDELVMTLQVGFSEPADLADDLVHRRWLTPYQARKVLLGNSKDLVLGHYILLDEIGAGTMARVFRARHRRLDRVDALKVIRPEHLSHPRALSWFQREARAAARLSHPNIVTIYDADEANGQHYLAMEYVEGKDLARLVKEACPPPWPVITPGRPPWASSTLASAIWFTATSSHPICF